MSVRTRHHHPITAQAGPGPSTLAGQQLIAGQIQSPQQPPPPPPPLALLPSLSSSTTPRRVPPGPQPTHEAAAQAVPSSSSSSSLSSRPLSLPSPDSKRVSTLSTTSILSSSSSSTSSPSVTRLRPVSILRNSSFRSLPQSQQQQLQQQQRQQQRQLTDSPVELLDESAGFNPPMSAPVDGGASAALAFPPLPPLPPFPTGSSRGNRKSAPPSTTVATTPTTAAFATSSRTVRPRRSRVSFREEVEVAVNDGDDSIAWPSRRPLSHGSMPSTAHSVIQAHAAARRVSADGHTAVGKATVVATPRPALKRASSSQPLASRPTVGSGAVDRSSSGSSIGSLSSASAFGAFDDFRPQTLRYPKVSAALARLSDVPMASAIWTACPSRSNSTRGASPNLGSSTSSGGSAGVAGGQLGPTMTLASLSPVVPAVTTPTTPTFTTTTSTGSGDVAAVSSSDRSGSNVATNATPARRGRVPRSPIPSWSSTCPSLVSSNASHRASVASTLTAPSMTSLLLSPLSPYDRLPSLPSSATSTVAAYEQAFVGDSDDGSDIDALASKVMEGGIEHVGVSGAGGLQDEALSPVASEPPSKLRLQAQPAASAAPPLRVRPRRSEPAPRFSTASTFDNSPTSYSAPRATERLLKLQSSLADLRMQRRATEHSPDSGPRQRRASADRASDAPAPYWPRDNGPPSPTMADLVRHHNPRTSTGGAGLNFDSDNESDLDLSLPLMNAALRSRVIPSSSRLLVSAAPRRASNTAERAAGGGGGWSGSESEEEEFSRTLTRIKMRKSVASAASLGPNAGTAAIGAIGGSLPARRSVLKRPSLPAARLSHLPELTGPSAGSTSSSPSSGPPTPAVRPPRPATAIGTTRPSGTAALITALVEQKYASREALPRPKRFVEGWGAPEVLHDDEWPPDHGAAGLVEDDDDDDDW